MVYLTAPAAIPLDNVFFEENRDDDQRQQFAADDKAAIDHQLIP